MRSQSSAEMVVDNNEDIRKGLEEPAPTRGWYEGWLERGLIPDWLVRLGIRRLVKARLREEGVWRSVLTSVDP